MLVGIAGLKHSGKSTMGDRLAEKHGYRVHSFARPLKEAAATIFNLTPEQIEGDLKETMDKRYLFTGLDPATGEQMTQKGNDEAAWWVRPSDGETYPKFLTPRLIMTTLGTEWGRRLHGNVWVSACLNQIPREGNHCITDCRFENEIIAVQDAGGIVVRLVRGELATSHASEAELVGLDMSLFDYVIDNSDITLEDFYEEVDQFVEKQIAP